MLDTVLAVDIGTSSLKAGLFTANGEDVFICRQRYGSTANPYIGLRWFSDLQSAVKKINNAISDSIILNCNKQKINITAISISGNGPTLVAENGLTFKWNQKVPDEINNKISGESKKSLFINRILTFKELYSQEYTSSKFLFSGPEFLIYQLTGNAITILPDERYKTAYWTEATLSESGIEVSKMPPFKMIGEVYGTLTEEAAAELGLKSGLPVYGAGPDFIAALIGTGTVRPGILCDRSGSSEGINFCVEKPVFAPGIRTLPSVVPGLWNISVLIPESSKMQEDLRLEKVAEAIDLLRKVSKENNIEFPDSMHVTGGQTSNKIFLQKKANKVGMKLVINKCKHAELLGDARIVYKK